MRGVKNKFVVEKKRLKLFYWMMRPGETAITIDGGKEKNYFSGVSI